MRGEHDHRGGRKQERVAVGRGRRDLSGAERSARTRTIFDHEALAEFGREMLSRKPRHHIGVAAGPERHDDGHRPGWPVRGVQARANGQDRREREKGTWS